MAKTTLTTYIADQQRTFIIPESNVDFQTLVERFSIEKEKHRSCSNLDKAIRQLNFNFYTDLLPIIARWASDHGQYSNPIEPLQAGITAQVTYTCAQVRYLLANVFFLNTIKGYGSLDLINLYNSLFEDLAIERIRCLIEYFRLSAEQQGKDDERKISIERYVFGDLVPDWEKQMIPIQATQINVFADRMETAEDAQGFVDFANKHIHIHSIIASATQEEVLFSCCPEAFVAILVCETLRSDEIVILRGCKRYVDYCGYSETFQFVGPYHNQNPSHIQDILVMDACYSDQFSRHNIDRDLGKAWAAFAKVNDESIVTGHWGCGVFGGIPIFKFLQQICAANVLGDIVKRLDYSVYGDHKMVAQFKDLLKQLEKNNKTVADVYHMMIKYGESGTLCSSLPDFSDYVDGWLNTA